MGRRAPRAKERLNLRLIVVIPVIFICVSLSVGLLAMALSQFVLRPPAPTSKDLLFLRSWIVGTSLFAGFLGALLAYAITRPVRRAITEAQRVIEYMEAEPTPIRAANEISALSTLFDQAMVSFIELIQAREVLDNIPEGIIALDREGKVAGMNLRAQELFEASLQEVRHKGFDDLLGPRSNGILARIARSGLTDQEERVHNRVPFCSPSGKETLLSVKVSPLRLKKEPHEFLGTIVAFTEQADSPMDLPGLIGKSESFIAVLHLVAKIAPTGSTVLLNGESGTGKEVVADAIHRLSKRSTKPLVKLNCAAIPEGLLESELFGHEKGAFTGATAKQTGKFELAEGGTIFLDEVADMSPAAQAKVLRVLQQKEFIPLGGSQVKTADVRIIAATNKDLFEEVQQGRFREDLFYRLNVITLSIPPLRERKSDIPLLCDYFLDLSTRKNNTDKKALSRTSLECLLAYSWPGNIRELQNVIERASLLSGGIIIQPEDLSLTIRDSQLPAQIANLSSLPLLAEADLPEPGEDWVLGKVSLNDTMEALERELIIQALKKSGGIQIEAAKLLRLNHKTLSYKIRRYNIDTASLKNNN